MRSAGSALRRGGDPRGARVDFVDESEVLTPADEACHVWKRTAVPSSAARRRSPRRPARVRGRGMIRSKARPARGHRRGRAPHERSGRARSTLAGRSRSGAARSREPPDAFMWRTASTMFPCRPRPSSGSWPALEHAPAASASDVAPQTNARASRFQTWHASSRA